MHRSTKGNPIQHLLHAYTQAPWRTQRQRMGSLLLAVVGLAMVASLYLDITSQAAIAGRRIQEVSGEMIAVQQNNADLQSKLAEMTSSDTMEKRAAALGYEPIDPNGLLFVVVPGYVVPKPAVLAEAQILRPRSANMPPEYTESLIAWLGRRLGGAGGLGLGAVP
jgi:hypothetical protein